MVGRYYRGRKQLKGDILRDSALTAKYWLALCHMMSENSMANAGPSIKGHGSLRLSPEG